MLVVRRNSMKIKTFMKRNSIIWLLGLLFAVASCSFTTKKFDADENSDKDQVLIELITYVLEKGHYDPKNIDDEFSQSVYDDFLNKIDPRKRYFTTADIGDFSVYEEQIDDQIRSRNIDFFNLVYERFLKRIEDSKSYYTEILNEPFDFTEKESINLDYENLPFASSKREIKERWRKQLKYSTLGYFYDLKEEQKLKKEKETEDFVEKTDKELEQEAREKVKNSLDEFFDLTDDLERKDWFSVYVNAIVEGFDPHSFYFAPQDKERFDIQMSGSLEGIGARLQKKMDEIKIMDVISGGPAWRGEELEVGDVIQKVRQEDEEKAVDISGMRLDDAVSLIKGPKGTTVHLTVKKVSGAIEEISIVRDVVEIEETYAKSAMVEKDDQKFGLIYLPKFYFNINDANERNAASDVRKEIIELKKENMHGLVIDLRNNGGGSLSTVVDIAGLFIEKGPVVQVQDGDKRKEILKDKDGEVLWDGPLVILVNELSASASEILAAAMQDYKRAVIIGGKQTYGKGTVQGVIDLNRWMRNSDLGDMGALKVTRQKFYRINGGSTQLEGVKSDVVVPDKYSYIDLGEKDLNNPLPWDQIQPANYSLWDGYDDIDAVIAKSKSRIAQNKQFNLIDKNAKWIKAQRDLNQYSINYEEYKADLEQSEAVFEEFESINDYKTNLSFSALPVEEMLFETDTTLQEKRKRWHKNLSKDVYVEEAIFVLEDLRAGSQNKKTAANFRD